MHTSGARGWLALLLCAVSALTTPAFAESAAEARDKGETALELKDYDTAIECLTRAKAMDPRDTRAREALAEAYRECRKFSEAENELQQLIQVQPNNPDLKTDLARLYREEGKFRQAASVYQDLLAQDPADPTALMGVAICLEGTEEIASAREYYNRVIQVAPRSTLAMQAKSRLQRLTQASSAIQQNKFFPIDHDWGERGLGWWDLKKMPIHVYIDSGSEIQGYRERMRTQMYKALETWSAASRGGLRFVVDSPDLVNEDAWKKADANGAVGIAVVKEEIVMPPDAISAPLHIHWVENLRSLNALGLAWTSPLLSNSSIIRKAHVWITTNRLSDGSALPSRTSSATTEMFESHDRMIQEVMVHELGHALGLPHSPNPGDIMAAGVYALNSSDMAEGRTLSIRDVASLSEHYHGFGKPGASIIAQDNKEGNWMYEMQKREEGNKAPSSGSESSDGKDKASSGDSTQASTSGDHQQTPPTADNKPAEDSKASPDKPAAADAKPDEQKSGDTKSDTKAADAKKPDAAKKPDDKTAADEKKPGEEKKDDSLLKNVQAERYDPVKDALFEMNCQHYDTCASKLLKIVTANPRHVQAHYLLAVTYVMLRKYEEAVQQYDQVMKLAPANSQLSRMAAEGLKKIGH